jgi:hypothetical protein
MRTRCCQVDVTHALTPDFGLRDFNAALLADHTAMLKPFVLATQAFVVFDGPENLGTKQAVTLRFEGAIVDGFRFFDFAERPGTDLFGRSHANLDGTEMLIRRELLEQVE